MTRRSDLPVHGSDLVDTAVLAADAAARAAGVTIHTLSEPDEMDSVRTLLDEIWRPEAGSSLVPPEMLRALGKAGNYVGGASCDGRLIGACVGFFGAPASRALHSHIAGVSAAYRDRNVGFALKVHQRAWALARGVTTISWTFDPLVSRNAYFNLVKLAARPVEYLANFYGGVHDGINGDDDTDRLLVDWTLADSDVEAACLGRPAKTDQSMASASVALAASEHDLPVRHPVDAPTVLVAVPRDVEALRGTDPEQARRWRVAVREVLGPLIAEGAQVVRFDPGGGYLVARRSSPDGIRKQRPAS